MARMQVVLVAVAAAACATPEALPEAVVTPDCADCLEWNAPREPVRIFGNSYWVGTAGLGAILITSDQGHVLIDGGLAESARPIAESIVKLGFELSDVKLILNSHAHYDHAGGIAALRRATGAEVAASPWSARVLESGEVPADDPQFGVLIPTAATGPVRVISDGETVRVGPLALTAHFTPGHTPGGTSWSWRSCAGDDCRDLVYGDSQTPVSAEGFRYSDGAAAHFERGHALLERISCDILLTPHPGASRLWERMESGDLIDPEACRRYAANAREALAKRLAEEAQGEG